VAGDAALLVDPDDADALVRALEAALGPEGARLRSRGLRRAASFTWEACAEATVAVYHAALADPPASSRPGRC
jgi:glycosyltransferase involved in cell wall biosynthesis